jgi:hypothetical protein
VDCGGERTRTEDFNEEVYSLEVRELVIVGVDTYTEEETCVAAVDDLIVPELRPSRER